MSLARSKFCITTTEVHPPDGSRLDGMASCDLDIAIRHKFGALCNKSVPFYMSTSAERRLGPATGFRLAVGNFIYSKWFQTYRSDIDHDRFLAALICPADMK